MTSPGVRGIVCGVGLAAVLAFAAQALADDGPASYANRIELAITPGAAFYRVELPFAVHQGVTRPDFGERTIAAGVEIDRQGFTLGVGTFVRHDA